MPWTVESIRRAYRLTAADELIAAALADAGQRERRWLGERVNGGVVEYEWHMRFGGDWWRSSLGLPAQAEELISISNPGRSDVSRAFLTDRGYTIRLPDWQWFFGGTITAQLRLADDTAQRDLLVSSLVMQAMGMPHEDRGRGWKRILRDFRAPGGLPGRLPDERRVVSQGAAAGDEALYYGVVPTADSGAVLSGLQSSQAGRFTLPQWTGRQYIVFIRAADLPVTGINIGGLEQIAAFRSSDYSAGDTAYVEWRSRLPWRGDIAGGAAVVIT